MGGRGTLLGTSGDTRGLWDPPGDIRRHQGAVGPPLGTSGDTGGLQVAVLGPVGGHRGTTGGGGVLLGTRRGPTEGCGWLYRRHGAGDAPLAASPRPAPPWAEPGPGPGPYPASPLPPHPGPACPQGVSKGSPTLPPPMETPEATGAIVPPEVSPELLEPLVTVVAILGELGATPGDIPLAGSPGSLRARLVALIANIRRAMDHHHGDATRLRRALATAGATTGATLEPTVVPPGDSTVPRATTGDAWAIVVTITREWREAVASVVATWATVAGDAAHLRDACGTAATTGATAGVTMGHLTAAMAQEDRARQQMLAVTRALPVASELATMAEVLAAHKTQVSEASAGLQAAAEATEKMAVAMVETAVAGERGRLAAVAHKPLGRLVAACHQATLFYCHLQRRLEDIEATVAAMAAGHGGPEAPGVAQEGPDFPGSTMTVQGGPGVPEDLMAAVAVAEALWDASARLAKCHLLGTLRVARGLLVNPNVPEATTVAQRCRDATAALPGLLPRGPR
ncbi:uncharacterized protein [Haliaeetus albicilla]|uniref:uncharacterized protein n=1 Tax=Haliaeetus albicilla TaxID=8969 RepID=UPI0037E854A0